MLKAHCLLWRQRAFTLLELSSCIVLVSLLALISIGVLLSSQARTKVARCMSDMKTIAGSLEMYHADHGTYPHAAIKDYQLASPLDALVSPVAYLATIPADPFGEAPFTFAPAVRMQGYNYKDAASTSSGMPGQSYGHIWTAFPGKEYMLHCCGPDVSWDIAPYIEYDPTNGSISPGDISLLGP